MLSRAKAIELLRRPGAKLVTYVGKETAAVRYRDHTLMGLNICNQEQMNYGTAVKMIRDAVVTPMNPDALNRYYVNTYILKEGI